MGSISLGRCFEPKTAPVALLLIAAVAVLSGCMAHRPLPPPTAVPVVPTEMPTASTEVEAEMPEPETVADASAVEAEGSRELAVETGLAPEEALPEEEETFAGEDLSKSPLDDLAVVTPEITPEESEAERALVVDAPPTFDIPIVMNDKVMAWLDYYSKQRERSFKPGLIRSGRYLSMFRRIYEEAGIPLDLVYMAHVESAYKTSAYSRARARGIFQFMTPTARHYGLKVDYWVDERLDPEKSARASARYLKKLYGDFGDWHLVLAAYNAGEGKIRRALARSGKTDFWGIAKTKYIRRETKNHVPAILAATLISKEPEKYGFEFEPDDEITYETIQVEGPADLRVLGECAGADFETMKLLNPALRRYQTPPNATTDVRVPVGTADTARAALANIPRNKRVLYARHRVRSGDTLSAIARAYGVGVRAIQQANNMGRRTLIRAGQTLVIPTFGGSGSYQPAPEIVAAGASGEVVRYRVRRGDTLSGIARRYNTSAGAIAAASGISMHKTLSIGERLKVVPGVRSQSAARRIASGKSTSGATSGGAKRLASSASGQVTHTVRRGENLWRIARSYRTTVDAICEANKISKNATLYPGTKLQIVK